MTRATAEGFAMQMTRNHYSSIRVTGSDPKEYADLVYQTYKQLLNNLESEIQSVSTDANGSSAE